MLGSESRFSRCLRIYPKIYLLSSNRAVGAVEAYGTRMTTKAHKAHKACEVGMLEMLEIVEAFDGTIADGVVQ